jgi:protein-S-isoprenylcysteine O-methyltransferase Ste14
MTPLTRIRLPAPSQYWHPGNLSVLIRHPIYLGLSLLAIGEALAFSNWPAFLIVLSGVVPSFAWRARAEETLLSQTFGERYALYQEQTQMIIPYLL